MATATSGNRGLLGVTPSTAVHPLCDLERYSTSAAGLPAYREERPPFPTPSRFPAALAAPPPPQLLLPSRPALSASSSPAPPRLDP
ncbi:unnamed protein product [Rangifer tarandus platyrhynchus]|uniref:Uncharacterized protein n=1 Tax=Rangifer tarandus platyrhynchus TaxID=3082113 RepID=A0AC59YVN2_RANTA